MLKFFQFVPHSSFLCSSICPTVFSLILAPYIVLFRSVLCDDSVMTVKDRSLKIYSKVVPYEEQDGSPKVFAFARIAGAGMTDLDEFQRRLYGVDPNHGYGSDLTAISTVVGQKVSFPISYPYKFYCTLMDGVLLLLGDVSTYGVYFWTSQPMKAVINKSSESTPKKISEQDRIKEEN